MTSPKSLFQAHYFTTDRTSVVLFFLLTASRVFWDLQIYRLAEMRLPVCSPRLSPVLSTRAEEGRRAGREEGVGTKASPLIDACCGLSATLSPHLTLQPSQVFWEVDMIPVSSQESTHWARRPMLLVPAFKSVRFQRNPDILLSTCGSSQFFWLHLLPQTSSFPYPPASNLYITQPF